MTSTQVPAGARRRRRRGRPRSFGFARARCTECGQERLVAFSCKGRCVCPSCTNRRMVEVAAHLSDSVVPAVPIRQWVLSVPKRLRPHLLRNSDLAGAVLRILLRVIRNELRDSVRGAASDARLGAVSFLHRFGSGLNPHPHFHVAVTDGLFAREHGEEGAPLQFHSAVGLDAERARALTPILQRRDAEEVASSSEPAGDATAPGSVCDHGPDRGPRRRWAQLLARVYEIDPLRCLACHGQMRILAFLTDPAVVRPLLRHLRIPEHPPPISPARGAPQTELIAVDPPSPSWRKRSPRCTLCSGGSRTRHGVDGASGHSPRPEG
ncbi:MAG: transposase zinc-binding domain-containing protein [Gemmatimonadota bacterium]|nr:transposase zinc-binding domain-containing protein [Gemmatimonadota bacterium]